jgi:SecD/SecF fusion protein
MNNPRLIFVAIVTLVCLYLVSPTVVYFSKVAAINGTPTREQRRELNDLLAKGKVITLGLDLQGGVDFLLSVDTRKLLRRGLEQEVDGLRRSLQDEGVDAAVSLDKDADRINFKLNDPTGENYAREAIQKLSGSYDIKGLEELRTGTVYLSPSPTQAKLETERAFLGALKVVNSRVDSLGLVNPVVVRQGDDRIRVQMPGQTDPARVRNTLLRAAELEFRLLHPDHNSAIQPFIIPGSDAAGYGTGIVRPEFLEDVPSENDDHSDAAAEATTVADAAEADAAPTVRQQRLIASIPDLPAGYVLRLGSFKTFDATTGAVVQEIKTLGYLVSEKVDLTGDNLVRTGVYTDMSSLEDPVQVTLEFNRPGTTKFREVTTNNVNRRFAVLLDDVVYTAPNILSPIPNGRCQITGGFSQTEALDLSLVLKAGALKAPLKVIEQMAIGPSLGQESIRDSIKAFAFGMLFLFVFMGFMYRQAGAIAIITMMLNVLMILAFLSMTGASLTLAGIGGLLLTMGMALDANVLIYERLREEIDEKKPLRAAISGAFSRAFSVILDSNITSLLPALVLVMFEVVQGPIKGFWLCMAVGLVANLYTGLTATRAIMEAWYEKTKNITVGNHRFFRNANVDWMGPKFRKVGMVFSGSLAIISVLYVIVHRPNLGVDFTGGVVSQVRVDGASVEDVREVLARDYADSKVVKIINSDNFLVTIAAPKGAEVDMTQFMDSFRVTIGKEFPSKAEVLSAQVIAPQIGSEFVFDAGMMVLITTLIVAAYLGIRFRGVFGIAAAIALLHDVFLSLGVFTLLGKPLTMDIVSALLVILGYSVNDTIVVFDRIREEMIEHPMADLAKIFTDAINKTLGRTMFTSVTVLLVLFSLFLFGGAALSDFSFILILGIMFGTYSSIFVASMIAWWLLSRKKPIDGPATPIAIKTVSTSSTVATLGATD